MGKKAAQGKQISQYKSRGLSIRNKGRGVQNANAVTQMKLDTSGGSWDTDRYKNIKSGGKDIGVDIVVAFDPNETVDATKIGLAQSLKPTNEGTSNPVDDYAKDRMVNSGSASGWYHDRLRTRNNPIYGAPVADPAKGLDQTPMDNNSSADPTVVGTNATYQLGYHYKDSKGTIKSEKAKLSDRPKRPSRGNNAGQVFETAALAIDGPQKGTYYGSVQWGWQTDAKGKFTRLPLSIVSQGVPSNNFMQAAIQWNAHQQSDDDKATVDSKDTPLYDGSLAETAKLGAGTTLKKKGTGSAGGVDYTSVDVLDGASSGSGGWIKSSQITDKKIDTVDLPVHSVYTVSPPGGVELNDGLNLEGPLRADVLPQGTRVVVEGMGPSTGNIFDALRYVDIKVVDGSLIGARGYVPLGALTPES